MLPTMLSTQLFRIGGGEIQSMDGTTPSDPAAMAIYDTAIVSMVLMLMEKSL